MIVCLAPNPAVDITYAVELERGVVNRATTVHRRAGGKGVNVARLLRDWGTESLVVLPLGGSSGGWLHDQLDADGLSSDVVPIGGETRSTTTLVEAATHPTSIHEPGPCLTPDEWSELRTRAVARSRSASALVVSGSLPPGVEGDQLAGLVNLARRPGVPVIVDTSGPALVSAARGGATCLKPNEAELMAATQSRTWSAGARLLLEEGAQTVMVSRGSDGLIFCSKSGYLVSPGLGCEVANPTGAGDAVVASIAASLVAGSSPDRLVRMANAAGAAAASAPLAGELDATVMSSLADRAISEEYSWDW